MLYFVINIYKKIYKYSIKIVRIGRLKNKNLLAKCEKLSKLNIKIN